MFEPHALALPSKTDDWIFQKLLQNSHSLTLDMKVLNSNSTEDKYLILLLIKPLKYWRQKIYSGVNYQTTWQSDMIIYYARLDINILGVPDWTIGSNKKERKICK